MVALCSGYGPLCLLCTVVSFSLLCLDCFRGPKPAHAPFPRSQYPVEYQGVGFLDTPEGGNLSEELFKPLIV